MDEDNQPTLSPPATPKLSHRLLPLGSESPSVLSEYTKSAEAKQHATTFTRTLPERLSPTKRPPPEDLGDDSSSSGESSSSEDSSDTPTGRKNQEAVYDPETGFLLQPPYIWITDPETGFVQKQMLIYKPKGPRRDTRPRRRQRSPSPSPSESPRSALGSFNARPFAPDVQTIVRPDPMRPPALNRPLQPASKIANTLGALPSTTRTPVGQAPTFTHAGESTPAPGIKPSRKGKAPLLGKEDSDAADDFFEGLQRDASSIVRPRTRSSLSHEPSPSPEPRAVSIFDRSQTPAPGAASAYEYSSALEFGKRQIGKERRSSSLPSGNINADPCHRSGTPALEPNLVGHGETTYAKVPDDPDEREELLEDYGIEAHESKKGFWLHRAAEWEREAQKPPEERKRDFLKENDVSSSWDKKWASAQVYNTSSWMNETWGPEIKDYRTVPERLRNFGGPHPSSIGALTPHYNKGQRSQKRISSGAQDVAGSPGKKKLRKVHRKLTAPAMDRESTPFKQRESTPALERGSTADERMSERHPYDQPRARSTSATPLHGRRLSVTAGSFCTVCRATEHQNGGPLSVCSTCGKNAYCSKECRGKHSAWHDKTCKPPEDQTEGQPTPPGLSITDDPANCELDYDPMDVDMADQPIASDQRSKFAPASGKENATTGWSIAEEQTLAMKEAMLQRKVAAMSGKLDAGAQLLKAMTDGGNDPETDVSTDDVTGDDEASIERDIGQYAEALRQLDNRHGQKSMTKASRKDDETLGRAAGSRMAHGTPSSRRVIGKSTIVEPPELGCITAHRVVKHRSLEYQVQRENQGIWLSALMMKGDDWDQEIAEYWYKDEPTVRTLRYLQRPSDDNSEPGPFGRFIKSAELVDHRRFQFDIRNFERFADPDDEHTV